MYAIDLHTHSVASPDGALREAHYRWMLEKGPLTTIAITDHDTVDFAQKLHKQLGDAIIVGEEITTADGEIIGLFLKTSVEPGLPAPDTVQAIHAQGGLVCVPHPYERMRKGLSKATLEAIAGEVDIIEIHNGRASLDAKPSQAIEWAQRHHIAMTSSSDAHGPHGWGRTYASVAQQPTRDNLVKLLLQADFQKGTVGFRGRLYPKLNRLKKRGQHA